MSEVETKLPTDNHQAGTTNNGVVIADWLSDWEVMWLQGWNAAMEYVGRPDLQRAIER